MSAGIVDAGAYLLTRTIVNRTLRLVRRLREPRFTFGLVAFLVYIGVVSSSAAWVGATRADVAGEWLLASFVVLPIAIQWVLGGDDEVISFTEAEIQHLFPAPATRRALIGFKIVRGAISGLPFVLFSTVVMGIRFGANPLYFALGVWISLVTVDLHVSGASRVRAWLAGRGLRGWVRRGVTLVTGITAVAAVIVATMVRVGAPPVDPRATPVWIGEVLSTAPLSLALAPFRAAPQVAMATSAHDLLVHLPGALAVLALHVAWVLQAGQFEDGAIRVAARFQSRTRGTSRAGMLRLAAIQIPLSASGPHWVAIVWKGVIGAIRLAPIRLVLLIGSASVAVAIGAAAFVDGIGLIASLVAAFSALYLAGLGPAVLRTDLRQDIAMLDVLRALPIRGRDVLLGELLGPWLVLVLGEWACLGAAVLLATGAPLFPLEARLSVALLLAVELPAATWVGLLVQNAAVVVFPESDAAGFDMAGRRLLTLLTTLFVLIGAGVPTAIAMVPAVLLRPWAGFAVWPVAALVGVTPVLVASWVAAGWLGARLERLDPAQVV